MREHIVDFDRALEIVLDHARGLAPREDFEPAALLDALGRVLARPAIADRDQPPFHRSTRDGFAVRAEAFGTAELRVTGSVRAGEAWTGPPVAPSDAIRIATGAPLPEGADAVVMIEHVALAGGSLRALPGRTLRPGENVVARASEARAGATVLRAGTRIGAAEIALAAACGYAELAVSPKPRVAILTTGDELVEIDRVPNPQQIRNSNVYALAAMVSAAGGEALRLAISPDRRDALASSIAAARQADLIVLSGGVSIGEYDLVEEMLLAAGAEFFFTGVRMQPGRPVVFGRLPDCYFFGLPGNPISTQVTFHCFVEPLLRAICGGAPAGPQWVLATLAENVAAKPDLTRLLPARMESTQLRLVPWQGSGDLAANAHANGYALLPAGGPGFLAGNLIRVLLR